MQLHISAIVKDVAPADLSFARLRIGITPQVTPLDDDAEEQYQEDRRTPETIYGRFYSHRKALNRLETQDNAVF